MLTKKKELYNAEVKERFLATIEEERAAKTVRGHLKKFSQVEKEMGKDIAQMDIHDAIEATQELKIKGNTTLKNTLVSARKYVRWCIDKEAFPDCATGFDEIKSSDVKYSSPNIFFMNEDDLINSMHQVCEFNLGRPEVPYMILCWIGLDKNDIIGLRDQQVDLENRVIYSTDGKVLIRGMSDEVVNALSMYVSCQKATRQFGAGPRTLIKDTSVNTFIKKMIPINVKSDDSGIGIPYKIGALDSLVTNLNTKYQSFHPGYDKITPKNALDSGRLFRLFMKECEIGDDVTSPKNQKLFDSIMHTEDKQQRTNYVSMYKKYKAARLKSL